MKFWTRVNKQNKNNERKTNMKKLMTMIAAVGMAFGLFADEPVDPFVSGTNFNNEILVDVITKIVTVRI